MGGRKYCGMPVAAVVVAACTMINIIYGGSYYCSGLLFYHWIHTFGQSKAQTAIIMSLMNGMMYATGLVSGPLTMKYGPRPVAAAGAILSGLGLIMSAFAQKLWILYISYGILTGFGWGCLLTTAAVSVQQHTNKHRALAAGISFTGTALGNLMYPLMFRLLESTFGWRGALMIISGLQLNCFPAALLFLPPPPTPPDEKSVSLDALDACEEQALTCTEKGEPGIVYNMNSQITSQKTLITKPSDQVSYEKSSPDALDACEKQALPRTERSPEKAELDGTLHSLNDQVPRHEKLHKNSTSHMNGQVSIGKSSSDGLYVSEKQALTSATGQVFKDLTTEEYLSELDTVHMNGQVSTEDKPHTIPDAKSTQNNQKLNEKLLVDSEIKSLTDHQPDANLEHHKNLPSQLTTTKLTEGKVMLTHLTANSIGSEIHVDYEKQDGNCCTQLIMKLLKAAKDGKQRLSSCGLASLACIIAYICRYSGMSILYSFLPMKVVSIGLPPETAAYLMSILSMGELVGRIGVTVTAWLHNRLPLIYFVVAAVLAGILEAVIGFTQTLMPMVVIVSILGLNAGVLSCIASTVVRDTVGVTNLPWVLGLAYGAAGIGNLTSIQLLAWIWQETDSISILFLMAGAALVCAGLSFTVYHGCRRAHKAK